MAISAGMLFRKIVGVLFLIVAGAFLGGVVLFTAFDGPVWQAPPQGDDLFRGTPVPPRQLSWPPPPVCSLSAQCFLS
ncbi:MAG: hypothetical protein VCD34_14065 [Planctomycetota bacterium]|jgi:hypothetical protein